METPYTIGQILKSRSMINYLYGFYSGKFGLKRQLSVLEFAMETVDSWRGYSKIQYLAVGIYFELTIKETEEMHSIFGKAK